jgi:uncharacterized surface protein with fasciclin (FAS1) repeats
MKSFSFVVVTLLALIWQPFSLNAQCSGSSHSASAVKVNQKPGGDIIDIAISSKDHTTLVAAVKAAGLVETLKGEGPFTVFAPTNTAFSKLPAGTVESLLQPQNKAQLASVLTYHVVAGKFDSGAVVNAIQQNGGTATLTTVQGGKIRASISGENVILEDENGNRSAVTAVDLEGTNGVIHVIDAVILPQMK